ncbi:transposase [Alkalimarinus coralli]|uniref:transposase n=1 Tax=Alkalimarinus coralli TaxID=2935863 RepID=UPI00202B3679|nr:transposase [Alkalimarinus coralli]
MPRKPRMYMAGVPCHVIQRGNNREASFFTDDDYSFYLECLKDACTRYRVNCHAYVLMTNHTHLLLSPESEEGISKVMQSLGRRYVQYVNRQYKRCGTLWESRHKASLVDAENYLLSCYRYIELNPVMANMVGHPGDYRWSSYRANAQGENNSLVTGHAIYSGLGSDKEGRLHNYRELFNTVLSKELVHDIRKAANFSMPLGNNRFKDQIEKTLGRSIGYADRGRPRKES